MERVCRRRLAKLARVSSPVLPLTFFVDSCFGTNCYNALGEETRKKERKEDREDVYHCREMIVVFLFSKIKTRESKNFHTCTSKPYFVQDNEKHLHKTKDHCDKPITAAHYRTGTGSTTIAGTVNDGNKNILNLYFICLKTDLWR